MHVRAHDLALSLLFLPCVSALLGRGRSHAVVAKGLDILVPGADVLKSAAWPAARARTGPAAGPRMTERWRPPLPRLTLPKRSGSNVRKHDGPLYPGSLRINATLADINMNKNKQGGLGTRNQRLKKRENELPQDDEVPQEDSLSAGDQVVQAKRYTSSDWRHILRTTPTSQVLRGIIEPVLTNTLWAATVWALHSKLLWKSATQVHGLVGSALGLLLVFRTNAAYARFWEGRNLWEGILAESRALARLFMLYRDQISREKVKRMANLICLHASLLAERLGAPIKDRYSEIVTRQDLLQLNRISNRPLVVLNMLASEIIEIPDQQEGNQTLFSNRERLHLLSFVDKLSKAVSASEKLVQTPVPLNYARHTARVLALWCLTLPLALVADVGLAIVPIMSAVSWGLYGIQEIGLVIEEPFRRALNLDRIVDTICKDVREIIMFPAWQKWSKKAAERQRQKDQERQRQKDQERQRQKEGASSESMGSSPDDFS